MRRGEDIDSDDSGGQKGYGSDGSSDADKESDALNTSDEELAQTGNFEGDMYVFAAKDLPAVDWPFGTIDSYIKVEWNGANVLPVKGEERGNFKKKKFLLKHIREGCPVRSNNRRPRYDMHYLIPFRDTLKEMGQEALEEAELYIQVWDKDKRGKDDFVSEVVLSSLEARRLCMSRKDAFESFPLQPKVGASKKEEKLAVGTLTLKFNDASRYKTAEDPEGREFWMREAMKIERKHRDKRSEMDRKLAQARIDFAV